MTHFRILQRLLLSALALAAGVSIAGCGSSSSTTSVSVPTTATIFYGHSAVVGTNGAVYAWGYNGFGQAGRSPSTPYQTPQFTSGTSGTGFLAASSVACGADHTIALANDGTVVAWGYNGYGQLGINSTATTYGYTPAKVLNLSGITAISAGGHHNLALTNTGNVWAWGYNASGQLGVTGVNATTSYFYPTPAMDAAGAPLANITRIAAGGSHSLALQEGPALDPVSGLPVQTLYAWGDNTYLQLGVGTSTWTASSTPQTVTISGITGRIVDIAAGGAFSLVLTDEGKVWTWGYNGFGQLGRTLAGTATYDLSPTAVTISTTQKITAIGAGLDHVVALANDGTLWAWGFNSDSSLGNSTITASFSATPVQVLNSDYSPFVAKRIVLVKGHHTIVQKADNTFWAWGNNAYSQLGDGTTINRSIPVKVSGI
jgi:alpha-tubulin suppressor-like RCC1 family protein